MNVSIASVRLLVVEDHHVVRAGLCALLNQEPGFTVVGQAADGAEAVSRWLSCKPDVTLMDLCMPVVRGIDAIKQIRQIDQRAVIIVLSTSDGDEDIHGALRAGARGYMLKDTNPADLFRSIRKVWAGKTHVPAKLADKLAHRLVAEALTERELQVVQLVVKGKSNKLIGGALEITEGTVKTHLKNILNKLGAASRTEAAAIALKRGIVHL